MMQEVVLLFSRICALFVFIPSVLLFLHLLDLSYDRSNKVKSPLLCSGVVVFSVCI